MASPPLGEDVRIVQKRGKRPHRYQRCRSNSPTLPLLSARLLALRENNSRAAAKQRRFPTAFLRRSFLVREGSRMTIRLEYVEGVPPKRKEKKKKKKKPISPRVFFFFFFFYVFGGGRGFIFCYYKEGGAMFSCAKPRFPERKNNFCSTL